MLERVVRGVQSCVADDAARAEQQADRVALLQVVTTQRWATEKFGEQDRAAIYAARYAGIVARGDCADQSGAIYRKIAALRSERSEMMAAITAQAAQIMALRDSSTLVERASEPAQVQQPIPAHTRRALLTICLAHRPWPHRCSFHPGLLLTKRRVLLRMMRMAATRGRVLARGCQMPGFRAPLRAETTRHHPLSVRRAHAAGLWQHRTRCHRSAAIVEVAVHA